MQINLHQIRAMFSILLYYIKMMSLITSLRGVTQSRTRMWLLFVLVMAF